MTDNPETNSKNLTNQKMYCYLSVSGSFGIGLNIENRHY